MLPFRAAPKPTLSAFGEILDEVATDAPLARRAERQKSPTAWTPLDKTVIGTLCAASVAFCVYAIATTIRHPDYFNERLLSSLQRKNVDPIRTGTVVTPPDTANALPVPIVVRARELKPEDYQIVMVFDDEAILATAKELFRVKVGSTLPGLGLVKEIVPNDVGGTVAAEKATLKTGAN